MAKCRSNQTSRRVRDPDVSWWCGAGKERSGKRRRPTSGCGTKFPRAARLCWPSSRTRRAWTSFSKLYCLSTGTSLAPAVGCSRQTYQLCTSLLFSIATELYCTGRHTFLVCELLYLGSKISSIEQSSKHASVSLIALYYAAMVITGIQVSCSLLESRFQPFNRLLSLNTPVSH